LKRCVRIARRFFLEISMVLSDGRAAAMSGRAVAVRLEGASALAPQWRGGESAVPQDGDVSSRPACSGRECALLCAEGRAPM